MKLSLKSPQEDWIYEQYSPIYNLSVVHQGLFDEQHVKDSACFFCQDYMYGNTEKNLKILLLNSIYFTVCYIYQKDSKILWKLNIIQKYEFVHF